MKRSSGLLVVLGLLLNCPSLALADQDRGCDGTRLKVHVTSLNGSGVTGRATICIGEDGLRGELQAENLTIGHVYTVWMVYKEGANTAGPGRFDSTVAEEDDEVFRGHVGGLQVSSGAAIMLFIFDHLSVSPNNVTRAITLLTPAGGTAAAQAVFNIP